MKSGRTSIHVTSYLVLGITFAILAGIMNGVFTLPMRYMGRWSWENVWALFILVSCVVMPIVIARATVPDFAEVIAQAPHRAVVFACAAGFAWGFGAIMFGQGISAVGISMANTLVFAISASFGSFIPILLLAPERLHQSQGKAITLGAMIGIAGIACCGYAGFLKEKSQKSGTGTAPRQMVGHARPFSIGLLLCAGSGLLSAVFNIGYSSAQPLLGAAVRTGHSAFAGSNLIWLLMLVSGAVPNLVFCVYLLQKNRSWAKFRERGAGHLYLLAILMGLLWGGNTFLYGFASPALGKLGPAIGWPLTLIAGLITANICGFSTGEWKSTHKKEQRWMATGLIVLLVAIITLGWSSTLG
ncbi:MAG TPA: L-rhamnose/proton symporter RhaT [Acidobacteriaceae bacterium]|nr:L-rhamnose/proton symporter RhaT [Acidobacteriaceae bacterium]